MYIGVWLGNLEQEDDCQLRHAWEVNVKVERKEIGWRSMVWFCLIQVRDKCWALCEDNNKNSRFHKIQDPTPLSYLCFSVVRYVLMR